MPDYSVALELSLLISLSVSFIVLSSVVIYNPLSIILLISIGVPLLFIAAVPMLLFIYPIINLLSQDLLSIELIRLELDSGVLSIRFVSIIIGIRFISGVFSALNRDENIQENALFQLIAGQSRVGYRELDQLNEYLDNFSVQVVVILQYWYYSYIVVFTWVFIVFFNVTIELKFAILVLFFIIDDWFIISDYYRSLKGRAIKSHKARIIIADIILFLAVLVSIYNQVGWTVTMIHIFLSGLIGGIALIVLTWNENSGTESNIT